MKAFHLSIISFHLINKHIFVNVWSVSIILQNNNKPMPHKLHICILFCMPYPSNMAANSCQLNTSVNHCLFHITSKLECRQVNVWTFKLLKKFKSLDIALLPLELKEVLLVHPSLWRWLKMDKNWRKYGVWKWCSIWNNKCSIWQGEHLGFKILNHRSIASRNERGIVKLKLEHPYHFRSLKMDKKYGI